MLLLLMMMLAMLLLLVLVLAMLLLVLMLAMLLLVLVLAMLLLVVVARVAPPSTGVIVASVAATIAPVPSSVVVSIPCRSSTPIEPSCSHVEETGAHTTQMREEGRLGIDEVDQQQLCPHDILGRKPESHQVRVLVCRMLRQNHLICKC